MSIKSSSPKGRGPIKPAIAKAQKAAIRRFLEVGMGKVTASPNDTQVTVTTTYAGKNGEVLTILRGYPPIPPIWEVRGWINGL
ncbi:MAG TPA: hypothetical protein VII43_10230 [Opitutaceae bacterium]